MLILPRFDAEPGTTTTLAGGSWGATDGVGTASATFQDPQGVAISPDGATALVADSFNLGALTTPFAAS